MISNVNIGTSTTTVLQAPADTRYVVHFVHFCNTSASASETLTINLSHDPSVVSTIVKEVVVPAGQTFVLGTSKNLSNINKHVRAGLEDQLIYLHPTEIISASSTGTNITATANYGVVTIPNNEEFVKPSPTPTPSTSPGTNVATACSCTKDNNNAWQQNRLPANETHNFFYVDWLDYSSPHSYAQSGASIFQKTKNPALRQCIYYSKTVNGIEIKYWNKVTTVIGPVYFGSSAYRKVLLEEPLKVDLDIGTQIYVCDSVNPAISPSTTPSVTPSISITPTVTPSISVSPSITPSITVTPSVTITPTITPSTNPSITPTTSVTPSISVTPSVTSSPGSSPSVTPSLSPTPSVTPSITASATPSVTPSITVSPSITPSITPSPSTLNVATAEYCKPLTAILYNITAFVPSGLQANGSYNFADGSISTLSQSARKFPAAQIANYTWVSPLFKVEMVSENQSTNLQTWRWTFTNWPKSDGTLTSISSSTSTNLYISESTKSKSQNFIRFNFGGNGTVILNFKNDDCSNISNNNCSNLEKPDYYYMYDKYLLSLTTARDVNKDIRVNSGIVYGGSSNVRKLAGWGEMVLNPNTNRYELDTSKYQHLDKHSMTFEEYIVDADSRHTIETITPELKGLQPGQRNEGSTNWTFQVFSPKLKFEVYVNDILETSAVTHNNIDFQYAYSTTSYLGFETGLANSFDLAYEVKKGDKVVIKAKMNDGGIFLNGADAELVIHQRKSSSVSNKENILKEWAAGDDAGISLGKMSDTQGTNFIKSMLPVHGLSYDEAVDNYITHLGGTEQYMLAVSDSGYTNANGVFILSGPSLSYYNFQDMFFINDTTLNVGDKVSNIYRARSGMGSPIEGTIKHKNGNLYCIKWDTSSSYIYNQRLPDTNSSNWHYINYGVCTENIFANIVPSPAPSPSITPSPTPSAVTSSTSLTSVPKVNPIRFDANNIGPWTGNRPGYSCPAGGTYGNGVFAFALTAPSGSFPYWSGPLFELRCLSSIDSATQTWQYVGKGWGTCQGPSFTSTSTKAYTDDVIEFKQGAGILKIYFS